MSPAKPKFMPDPEGWNQTQCLAYLGLSASQFYKVKEKLKSEGMPQPDDVTGKTNAKALTRWWNRRHGVDDGDTQDADYGPNAWDRTCGLSSQTGAAK